MKFLELLTPSSRPRDTAGMERDFEAEAFRLVVEHSRAGGRFKEGRRQFDNQIPISTGLVPHKLIEAASKRLTAIPHALNHAVAIGSQLDADRKRLADRLDEYCDALDVVRRLAIPPLNASGITEAYVSACALKSHLRALAASSLPTFQQMRDG